MRLVSVALDRPVTVLIIVVSIVLAAGGAIFRMKADIFPRLSARHPRGAALRRNGSVPDGGLSHLLHS